MPNSERLREFMEIVDRGTLSAAARTLELPRATLSRRMSAMEKALGVRLLDRGSTRVTLTPAGEELYRRARRIVADTEAAWASVRRMDDVPRGLLRVSISSGFWAPLFVSYLSDFPEVQLEVRVTTQQVNLAEEGVDVALRVGPIRDLNLISRKVATLRSVVVASPAYLDARGRPSSPEELEHHDCLMAFGGARAVNPSWPLRGGGQVHISGRFASNAIPLLCAAAVGGHGLALLPSKVVADELAAGRLEVVLEEQVGTDIPISLVWLDHEHMEPKVRAFVDRAVVALREGLA